MLEGCELIMRLCLGLEYSDVIRFRKKIGCEEKIENLLWNVWFINKRIFLEKCYVL